MKLRAFIVLWAVTALAIGLAALSQYAPVMAGEASSSLYVPLVATDYCGPFVEPFDDPANGWFTGSFDALDAQISGGEYRLSFTGKGAVWLVTGPVCERMSYRAEVDARWIGDPGNFIGLLFEIDEGEARAYLFAVNTDDRVWLLFDVRNEALDILIPPTGHDAILPGNAVNRLAVESAGNKMVLSVNDEPVGELNGASTGIPVLAGVAAASYTTQSAAEARFDNFYWRD